MLDPRRVTSLGARRINVSRSSGYGSVFSVDKGFVRETVFDGCGLVRDFDLAKLAEVGLFGIGLFGLMDFGLDAALGICQNGRENEARKGTGARPIIDGATFPRKALNNSPRAGGRGANLAMEEKILRKGCKEQSSQMDERRNEVGEVG